MKKMLQPVFSHYEITGKISAAILNNNAIAKFTEILNNNAIAHRKSFKKTPIPPNNR